MSRRWPKPYPYQKSSVKEIDELDGRSLLALDPGLGKTLIALRWLFTHPEAMPAVVVCPASVKYHWLDKARLWAQFSVEVLEGRRSSNLPNRDLIVVNYDILKDWVRSIRRLRSKCVVLDESQYIANYTARTRAVRSLCKGVPFVLALSGTPLMNKPIELFNTASLLCPEVFGKKKDDFAHRYCGPHLTKWGWKFDGASNVKELHRKLVGSCMIRYRKQDVLSQLPEKQRRLVPLPLTNRNEYEIAKENFLDWLESKDEEKAQKASKVEALAKVGYLLRLAAELKLPFAIEWIKDYLEQSDEKLVVFGYHKKILGELQGKLKFPSVLVDGSVTGKDRHLAVKQFEQDPKVRLFIGNIRAAGVGIDRLQTAHTAVFVELTGRPADVLQAEDRLHRIGQTRGVWVYYLVAKGTMEARLGKFLRKRRAVVSRVLDGEKSKDFDLLKGVQEDVEDSDVLEDLIGWAREKE